MPSGQPPEPQKSELELEWGALHERLIALNSAPDKDMPAIDEVIGRLARLQLAIKAEHGLNGNNPVDD